MKAAFIEQNSIETARIEWVDTAKAITMLLVFHGHLVGAMPLDNMFWQVKFIYSFHIPLFFFLSGFIYKHKSLSFSDFCKKKFRTRIIPVLFFNVLNFIFILLGDILAGSFGLYVIKGYITRWDTVFANYGIAFAFNYVATWFLICLFVTELIYFFLSKVVKDTRMLIVVMFCCSILGYNIVAYLPTIKKITGIPLNFWYATTALTAVVFYMLGTLTRKTNVMDYFQSRTANLIALLILFLLLSSTFNLNQFRGKGYVTMNSLQYGNFFFFYLSAISGIFFILFLSRTIPKNKSIIYAGENTLILLGLNGIFFRFINFPLISLILPLSQKLSYLLNFLLLSGISMASFMLCYPFIYLFKRHFSYFAGKDF